jgi:enoyl-CoA hydratase
VPLGRPERANALRRADKADLAARIRQAAADGAGAIVLTGAPAKAFCAGSDIDEMAGFGAVAMREMLDDELAIYRAILEVPVPVVAAVNGPARGAGFITAMCCDQFVMAEEASVGLPELTIGVSIPLHGFLLPFLVGLGHARRMYYTGEPWDAATALQLGIANEVVAGEQLEARSHELAAQLAAIEGGAFEIQKRLLNRDLLERILVDVVTASLAESSIPFESGGPGERMRRVREGHRKGQ